MRVAGIVCEYNPFHNGHLYHINKVRETAEYIVCAMSGNFVQRGECAYLDKWLRAEIAIRCGADIVLDLPVPWSCASAETFARGSVGILGSFGVDTLSFGCESDDLALLTDYSAFIQNKENSEKIKTLIASGMSYPAALYKTAAGFFGEDKARLITSPNNTLACEYIKSAKNQGFDMGFLPIKRAGCFHDSDTADGIYASASNIRKMGIDESKAFLPEESFALINEYKKRRLMPCRLSNNERGILSSLRETPFEDYSMFVEDERGLAKRIYEAVRTAESLEMLYDSAKTKAYTHARVRREILALYLKIPKAMREGIPPYIRVLAANERGLNLLCKAKKSSPLPIVTKHSEMANLSLKARELYALQCSSSDKFALLSEKILPCGNEQRQSFFKV